MVRCQYITWFCYRDDIQYRNFLPAFTDCYKLPATFSKWKLLTENHFQMLEDRGISVVRVYANNIEEFIEFCHLHGKGLNAEGRTFFADVRGAKDFLSRQTLYSEK